MNKIISGAIIGSAVVLGNGIINESDALSIPNYYVTLNNICIKSSTSLYSDTVANINKDELVQVIRYSNSRKYVKIKYKEYKGWTLTENIKAYEDDLCGNAKTTANLNLRNFPTTNKSSYVIKTLPKNTELIILKKLNGWYYVKPLDGVGMRGWVCAKYVKGF